MDNRIFIANSDSFETSIMVFEESLKKISDIFENQNKNMEQINGTEIWTGMVQKSIYEKYIEMKNNYPTIEESLKAYIDFMKKVLMDYKRAENEIDRNAEINASELNVNS